MADRRRRSPAGSSRTKGKERESARTVYDGMQVEEPRMRAGPSRGPDERAYSSSSSSSSSYIDISRVYPRKGGLREFFTTPSERRRLRRRRSSRLMRGANSSSSSVNEDLAYGTGFLKRPKHRGVRNRRGKEIGSDRVNERENNHNQTRVSRESREETRPALGRAQTDAEILAIGAGLAKLARDQNKRDLRDARNGIQPNLVGGTSAGSFNQGQNRGLANSRPSHGSDTVDEDGWESASESEHSVDSRLAFGEEGKGSWSLFGRKKHRPLSRKNTMVDPRLFGPQNTLHGIVTEPVGFGDIPPWTSTNDFGQMSQTFVPGPSQSYKSSQTSLQHVYPIPTSDPGRFDAAASSVVSGPEPMIVSRPGPIPIQQPQPIAPISQSVYGRSESGPIPKQDREPPSSSRGKSLAEAALVGVAGAAVGAAIASSRDDRKRREAEELEEKYRLRRRDSEREKEDRRRDSERESRDDRRRDKRASPDREERREKRREKDDSSRVSSRRKGETREERDERRERRREEPHDEDQKRDKRREQRRTKSETAVPQTGIDPFQYQVPDDAFATPTTESQRKVESVPDVHYVTVEREPDFNIIPPIRDARTPDFMHMHRKEPPKYFGHDLQDGERDSRDRALHEAEDIYEEAAHSTAPIAAAAMGAAVAAVHHADVERESRSDKRRAQRRNGDQGSYDEYDSKPRAKGSEKERDPIQEEADRAYREIVMARKIASQVIRSRSASPDRSVIEKYNEQDQEEPVRIVTPPGMEDHKKVGPYDAPNADFRLDHVLEDPMELRNFRISSANLVREDAEGPYLKRDPDADRPRPLLNLVRPTPAPSPMPEKQAARPEPASSGPTNRKEPERSSTTDSEPKDGTVTSPTASTVSKGVTWGENETKHFEVESPHEHRDEFASNSDIQARAAEEEPKPAAKTKPKSKGWGVLAAALGAGAGAAAVASSSETPKTSKAKDEEKRDAPYEYRGVVVEPESPPQSSSQRAAPPAGPKPAASQSSKVPGAFNDDLDFAATVAAGLQDTGFDPNIVIDDPSFRRRDSPPGTNDYRPYRAPFAETVSDLGNITSEVTGARDAQGFVLGEVASTPQNWRSVSPPKEDETPPKPSKKEQKRRDKEKRRSGDVTPLEDSSATRDVVEEPESYFEAPLSKKEQKKRDKLARQTIQTEEIASSVAEEIVEEPESYFETPKKSKKKSKKGSSSVDDYAEDTPRDSRKVSVPIDAFDDLRNDDEEWAETKKSKKKSKRDSDRYDSPARSVPSSEITSELERSSSKKSKDKSKRKSEQCEPEPTEVSLPPSTPSETSRDGDFDDSRGNRKSSTRDSGIFNSADRGESRSVASADTSRYDDDEARKSKKKSRSSTKDDYDDSRSVASAPAGDEYEDAKRSKKKDKDKDKEKDKKSGGGFFGLFGSKSEVSARDESPKETKDDFEDAKKKKKKRSSVADSSSIYSDAGAQSVGDLPHSVSNGNGTKNGSYEEPDEPNSDDPSEKTKSRSRSESTSTSKKDSFLDNAGTLGAGVGLAGAAVAIAAQQNQQSKAANMQGSKTSELERPSQRPRRSPSSPLPHEIHDPEITERQFRPSIDPQYGDLLPLPPSKPGSPKEDILEDFPELPESPPDTPEPERTSREKSTRTVRKSLQETPMKSPSQSAVPLNFLMRNRSQPSSPALTRSSPLQSPATLSQEGLSFPRSRQSRPTSWDSSKEYKPLYLVETNRRNSIAQVLEPEEELPALPPSQRTSRSSSQLDVGEMGKDSLTIDTALASSKSADELPDSEQSTPKAAIMTRARRDTDESFHSAKSVQDLNLPLEPELKPSSPEASALFGEHVAEAAAAVGLASTIGYFASSPPHQTTRQTLEDLPPAPSQPSPVDPMTKDRSSYLLQSSPMAKIFTDVDSSERDIDSPSRNQKPSLPSSSLNEFTDAENLHDLSGPDTKDLPETETAVPLNDDDGEPADEFTFTKSKKGKSKDKKKSEGLSQSSTQDDFSVPESSKAFAEEVPTPAENEPAADDFFATRSKRDKKKDKKKKPTSVWEERKSEAVTPNVEEQAAGKSRDLLVDTVTPLENKPFDDLFISKSQKDRKRDKKKFGSTWEQEASENAFQEIEETASGPSRAISQDVSTSVDNEAANEFFTPKSKKDKKKDKKKGESTSAWEPEVKAMHQSQGIEPEPVLDTIGDLQGDIQTPGDVEQADKFSAPKSKKSKGNDKSREMSASTWDPEESTTQPPTKPTIDEDRELAEKPLFAKPAKQTSHDIAAETSDHSTEPQDSSKHDGVLADDESKTTTAELVNDKFSDIAPEMNETSAREDPADDAFTAFDNKKGTKKKGKSRTTWEQESEIAAPPETILSKAQLDSTRDMQADAPPAEEFVFTASKKSKKDKKQGKSVPSWEPEEDRTSTQPTLLDEAEGADDYDHTQEFEAFSSKKGKKKNRKSSSIVPEDDFAPTAEEHAQLPAPTSSTTEQFMIVESESVVGAPDSLSSTPTPMGGPGAWPITPATPWTGGEVPESSSKGYFPSDETSQRTSLPGMTEESQSKANVPSTVLQVIVAGATLLGATSFVKESTGLGENPTNEVSNSKSLDLEGSPFPRPDSKPALDGLTAGYDNHQLSLAKQLQEEFTSGSKKSKKDKKRRSLPPTPARESSRSRALDDLPDPLTRARSLSIGPAAARSGSSPLSSERKTTYSEGQLELARQLKEDFGSGSKKSKKHTKKRQGLSRSSTQDDMTFDRDVDELRLTAPDVGQDVEESQMSDNRPTGDGFTAGYQEDQLSIARQLQAEFGKKSKKDKKHRSTTQTPQDQDPRDDYFGEPSQAVVPDATEQEPAVSFQEPALDQVTSPDGLAVGYNEEQLDFARQLKEEFESGSKKGKKDKKRRSTSQTPLEQEPRDDYYGEPSQPTVSDTMENQVDASIPEPNAENAVARDGLAVGYKAEQLDIARQLKEEFGSGSNKSKRDKKRRGLLRSNTESDFSSDAQPRKDAESGNFEDQRLENTEDGPSNDAEADFAFITKNSKKDKKGKKRGTLLADSQDVDLRSQTPRTVDNGPNSQNLDAGESNRLENGPSEPVPAEPEDRFASFTTLKKVKKGKKRRSLVATPAEDDLSSEPRLDYQDDARDLEAPTQPDFKEEFSTEPVAAQPEDVSDTFTTKSKKDKKSKKRDALQRSTTIEEAPSDDFGNAVEALHGTGDINPRNIDSKLAQAQLEDDWSLPAKPSKKDKKKRQSTSSQDESYDKPDVEASFIQPGAELSTADVIAEDLEEASEPSDDFGFSTRQPKKEKKRRGSLLQNPTFDKILEQPLEELEGQRGPEIESRDIGSDTATVASSTNDSVDGFEYSSKKLKRDKKDKKKRGSLLRHSTSDETPEQETSQPETQPELEAQSQEILDIAAPLAVDQDDRFEYSSKKSKKDKKNRKSLQPPSIIEDIPKEIEEHAKQHDAIVAEASQPSDFREEAQVSESATGETALDENVLFSKAVDLQADERDAPESTIYDGGADANMSLNNPEDETPSSGPPDLFHDFAFTTKKSKKDKKNRKDSLKDDSEEVSRLSTPLNPITEPKSIAETTLPLEQPEIAPNHEPVDHNEEFSSTPAVEENNEEPTDEWSSFSVKKLKKDKKRKGSSRNASMAPSGTSTPLELVPEPEVPSEPSLPTDNTLEQNEATEQPLSLEPGHPTSIATQEEVAEPADEWASFSTKKSKGKKKRKSGLSTPAEPLEEPSYFEPEKRLTDDPSESSPSLAQAERHLSATKAEDVSPKAFDEEAVKKPMTQVQEARDLEQEPADDAFAFVTKRSKKDKKGSKKSSRAPSESRTTTSGPSDALPIDTTVEAEPSLPSKHLISSPVTLHAENPRPDEPPEPGAKELVDNEDGLDTFASLSRKPSKKDKRKRQATVVDISINDNPTLTSPPLTSWADEIEEAEVERSVPVIEDIAKDESLSHIASTTESAPVDDFFRPTKKGKKGKKRFSEPGSPGEPSRPTTVSGIPNDGNEDENSNIPILAAAGAALTATALLRKADENASKSSTATDTTTPQRKLSKKEKKKKKSIDHGPAPRDDLFDDPALWEGAEPKTHEEVIHVDDDAGSDGFGFAHRFVDEPTLSHEPWETRQSSYNYGEHGYSEEVRPVSPSSEARVILEEHASGEMDFILAQHPMVPEPVRESPAVPREGQQERYVSEELGNSSSVRDKTNTETPDESYVREGTGQHNEDYSFESPRSFAETAPSDQCLSFEERLPIIQEHISTPSRTSVEQPHSEHSIVFEDGSDRSPIRPLSTSKFGRSSLSELPVVHEEDPAHLESEYLPPPHYDSEANRDSAFVTGSPVPQYRGFTDDHEHVRDSGVHLRDFSPAEKVRTQVSSTDDALARLSWPPVDEETETVDLHRSQRSIVETSSNHHDRERVHSETRESHSPESHRLRGDNATDLYQSQTPAGEKTKHHDEPVVSRDLFPSYKSTEERSSKHQDEDTSRDHLPSQRSTVEKHTDLHRVPTLHEQHKPSQGSLVKQRVQRIESPDFQRPLKSKEEKYTELSLSEIPKAERLKGISEMEAGVAIAGASLGFAAARKLSQEHRPPSAQSQRSSSNINRIRTPDPKRPNSVSSNRSGTPPLRRSDRKLSGDLRSLSQRSKPDLAREAAELAALATSTSASASQVNSNPTANEGRARAKDMADVYDGFGEGRMGSPRSPTRPHSMRRRQSMQVLDLERTVEQLATENRMLAEAKAQAERALQSSSHASSSLVEKDAEIDSLKRTLDWLQNEVTRLTQVNEGLNSAVDELGRRHNDHNDKYGALESQHAEATRELQEVRDAHDNLSAGMEGIVRNEVQGVVQDKDREIAQLRAELDAAKEQIREMQRQILASKADEIDFLTVRDEDYFDNACQMLCQHVQQWVLRFSKFSDMRACRLSSEINNEKTLDRLDNAILDGSDVDNYLADRIKRRDVFMSMTMNMVWEFIFTRYLFGMDREQRQKLKSLEKTLSEVGPAAAVHHWRATTLTLLSKREAFVQQRQQDTQAVVHAIIETLSEILPPPTQLETQIEEQLTRVMQEAVDLSIEMRTQRAEYMMLPPLLPEYDANGDLASKVSFNAALMNERSGDTVSNEELEEQNAIVRVVLFPLVVKKGDDRGEGDEEIVVCPAQVLVAKPPKKSVRVISQGSVQGNSRVSLQSSMPTYGEGSVI